MTGSLPPRLLAALVLALLCATACGYHAAGREDGARIPVTVESVEDRSREPLFGALVREGLARRTLERGETKLLGEGKGGARLRASLARLEETPRAFSGANVPREYLLAARADAEAVQGSETLGKVRGVTATREFPAGRDVNETRRNKDRALRLLADDLAGEIVRALLPFLRDRAP